MTLGKLTSRKNFPIMEKLNGKAIRVSPRAVLENVDRDQLPETLKEGLVFIPYSNTQPIVEN